MKKFTFILLLVTGFIVSGKLYSQCEGNDGDLLVCAENNDSNHLIKASLELYSIPFEGLNDTIRPHSVHNRTRIIQNGSNWKLIRGNLLDTIINYPVKNHYNTTYGNTSLFYLGSSKEMPIDADVWVFAKYLLKIEVIRPNGQVEKYSCFINSLDSRYQSNYFPPGYNGYGKDIKIKYDGHRPFNNRVFIEFIGAGLNTVTDSLFTSDTLSNGLPSREFKVWQFLDPNRQEPYEKNFYARSTPFPISKSSAEDTSMSREFRIGTKVIFDTVYRNNDDILGGFDTRGYNTNNEDYYYNPFIPSNTHGRTYMTPGAHRIFWWPEYHWVHGIKIIADEGDTMIFSDSIKFWVYGQLDPFSSTYKGDTLLLNHGSILVMGENAKLNTFWGGTLIGTGGKLNMDNSAIVRAFENSSIGIFGTNPTIINNGKMQIDSAATLTVGDNATLVFEGSGAYLDISQYANLILGENANIEFRNGAYLDAENITFEGNNGATWEGLVFHNAGGETQIKNCIFKDAKISIDIKNTTGCYADLEKRIIDNTFIQSGASTHSIQAENIFKLLLRGNTFNLVSGKTGVEINNTINAGPPMAPGGGGESSCINTSYALNILENTFNNGKYQLYLNCYASQVTPFWVFNNIFNSSSTTKFSLIGRKITGDIKMNNFVAQSQVMHNVLLMQSSVNMLDNTMNSQVRNIVAGS